MEVRHLSEQELREYRKRVMSPAVLLAADDHLSECEDCRKSLKLLESEVSAGAILLHALTGSEPTGSRHLSYDELVAFAEDDWTKADRHQVVEHLLLCAQCSGDAEDLQSFRAGRATRSETRSRAGAGENRRPSWLIPVWAGAAALVLAGVFLGLRLYPGGTQPEPSVLVRLNDGGGNTSLDSTGRLVTPSALDPEYAARIRDALLHQRVETTAPLVLLTTPPGKLLGEPRRPSSLRVVAPSGTVVLGQEPVFRWESVAGASGYVVSIYDTRLQRVMRSPQVQESEWKADHSLQPGEVYTWQVTASVGGTTVRAPVPPAPEARFQVVSQADKARLDRVRREHANSHLLLGLLYAQVGAFDESERELTALRAANPDSSVVAELLASLRRLRQSPAR